MPTQVMLCGASDVIEYVDSFQKIVRDDFMAHPINFLVGTHNYDNDSKWRENSSASIETSHIIIFVVVRKYGSITWETEYQYAKKLSKLRCYLVLDETHQEYLDFKATGKETNDDELNNVIAQLAEIELSEQTIVRFTSENFKDTLLQQLIRLRDKVIIDRGSLSDVSKEILNGFKEKLLGKRGMIDSGFRDDYLRIVEPVKALEAKIEECFSLNLPLLLFGETLSGKSRAIYEFLKLQADKHIQIFSSAKNPVFPKISEVSLKKDKKNIFVFDDFHNYITFEEDVNRDIQQFFLELKQQKNQGYDIWVIATANIRKYCEDVLTQLDLIDNQNENAFFYSYDIRPLTKDDKQKLLLKFGEDALKNKFLDSTIGSYYYPLNARLIEFDRFSTLIKKFIYGYYAISIWRKKNHGNIDVILEFLENTKIISEDEKQLIHQSIIRELLPLENWINRDLTQCNADGTAINIRLTDEVYKLLLGCLLNLENQKNRSNLSETEFLEKISFQIISAYPIPKTYSQLIRLASHDSTVEALIDNYLDLVSKQEINSDSFLFSIILDRNYEKYSEKILDHEILLSDEDFFILRSKLKSTKGYNNALEVFNAAVEERSFSTEELNNLFLVMIFKAKRIKDMYELHQKAKELNIMIFTGSILVSKIINAAKIKSNEYNYLFEDIAIKDIPVVLSTVIKGATLFDNTFSKFWASVIITLKGKSNAEQIGNEVFKYLITNNPDHLFRATIYTALINITVTFERAFSILEQYISTDKLTIGNVNTILSKLRRHSLTKNNQQLDKSQIFSYLEQLQRFVEANPRIHKDLLYYSQLFEIYTKQLNNATYTWNVYIEDKAKIDILINTLKSDTKKSKSHQKILIDLVATLMLSAPDFDEAFTLYGIVFKEAKHGKIKLQTTFFNVIISKIKNDNLNESLEQKLLIMTEMKVLNLYPSPTTIKKFFFPYYGFSSFIHLENYIRTNPKTRRMSPEIESYFFKLLNTHFKSDDIAFSKEVFSLLKWLDKHIFFIDENRRTLYSYFIQLFNKAEKHEKKEIFLFMRNSIMLSNSLLADTPRIKMMINNADTYEFCKQIYIEQESAGSPPPLATINKNTFSVLLTKFVQKLTPEDDELLWKEVVWCMERGIWVGIPILKRLAKSPMMNYVSNVSKLLGWLLEPQYFSLLTKDSLATNLSYKREKHQPIKSWIKSIFSGPILNKFSTDKAIFEEVREFETALSKLPNP